MTSTAVARQVSTAQASAAIKRGPPLDFSFQEIKDLAELSDRVPSSGCVKRKQPAKKADAFALVAAGPGADDEASGDESEEYYLPPCGVRLCYNELTSTKGLLAALATVMEDPRNQLEWIDLSHNLLTTIDEQLAVDFPNLSVVYLHGNQIVELKEITRLRALPGLMKLTLHGNCYETSNKAGERKVFKLEDAGYYRSFAIYALRNTRLKSLDFIPVTAKDKENAALWAGKHKRELRAVREQLKADRLAKEEAARLAQRRKKRVSTLG